MKKLKLPGLLSLPIILAIAGFIFLSLRSLERAAGPGEVPAEQLPRYELQNVQWLRTGADGQPQFVAQSDRMAWYDNESARMYHVELSALGGGGSPWKLTAPEGQVAPKSREVLLHGSVMATGHWSDGSQLAFHTERLWADTETKRLHTDADIALDGAARNVMATGMESDFAGKNVRLLSKVRARYDASQKKDEEPAAPAEAAPAEETPNATPAS